MEEFENRPRWQKVLIYLFVALMGIICSIDKINI